MNNIIIGTAGHVDHGKTSLIRALTGIDTDRLQEEKIRGITIELGFANIDLGDGISAGIVDVPGHEKFIKNMLAGAGGIDIALLVIAADEGFMPQTREHFSILTLLGIKKGVVALTKSDTVDKEWLNAVLEEVQEELKDSFLEGCEIIPVSSKTGENLDVLKKSLKNLAQNAESKNLGRPFRIPIDRVFTIDGFGTVITGTLIEGKVSLGDKGMIYPSKIESRIRNIQVHGADAQYAVAGQRVAINLGGIKKDKLQRGDCLTVEGSIENTMLIDCQLTIVKEFNRVIKNNTRLHFHTGTRNVLCNAILLDKISLSAGQTGFVQLKLEEEVPIKYLDKYIVRFYSPLETVGGGTVLEPLATKHKRNDDGIIAVLNAKISGDTLQLASIFTYESETGLSTIQLAKKLELPKENCLKVLKKCEDIVEIREDKWFSKARLENISEKCVSIVSHFHQQNSSQSFMDNGKLKSKLGVGIDDDVLNYVIEKHKDLEAIGQGVKLKSFSVDLNDSTGKILLKLRDIFQESGYIPPMLDELEKQFEKQKSDFKKAIKIMCDNGELEFITATYLLPKFIVEKAKNDASKIFEEKGEIILSDFRDITSTSRKYALAVLEYLDKKGITKRVGDSRILI